MYLTIGDIQIPFENLKELRTLLDALSPVQSPTPPRRRRRRRVATTNGSTAAPEMATAKAATASQDRRAKPKGASPTKKKSKAELMKLPLIEAKLTWDEVDKVMKAIGRTDKMQLRSELRARQRIAERERKKAGNLVG